ncbi:MAG: hypothetical protein HGB35_01680, partial [Geobacteraceae bacterium]|nr:hypothetical protein [Geobacteraceae bacterium]
RSKVHKDLEHSGEGAPAAPASEPAAPEASIHIVTPHEEAVVGAKPKRARTPRKKKPETAAEESVVSEPAVETPPPVAAKPRRRAAPKKAKETVVIVPEPEAAPAKASKPAKPAARPRRKKKDEEVQ